MGAASSSSVAAVVEAYPGEQLEEIVGGLPSDCRAALLRGLQVLAEEKAAREVQPAAAAADVPPTEVPPPREEVEPLEAPAPAEKQAPPAEELPPREQAPPAEELPPREEAEPLEAPTPTQKQAPPAEEEFVEVLTTCTKSAPVEEALPEMVMKESPAGELPSELTKEQALYLQKEMEALADPKTGGVRAAVLESLFERLGAGLEEGELQALLAAAGSQGKAPTPGQFLDFVLEGVPVV